MGLRQAGDREAGRFERVGKIADRERPVLAVQEQIVEPRIAGLVVADMRVAFEGMTLGQALEDRPGIAQPVPGRALQKRAERLLQGIDARAAIGRVDHDPHAALRFQRARQRVEAFLRVWQMVQHAAAVDIVEGAMIPCLQERPGNEIDA